MRKMYFKVLGAIMVMISSSIIGFIIANSYKKRPELLRELQTALSMLETEIGYSQNFLPDALENIARNSTRDVSRLFLNVRKHLMDSKGYMASEAWELALKKFYNDSYLIKNDYYILNAFGKYLGSTDREDQIKSINQTIDNLKQQEKIAYEEKQKNETLWRYLGILSGIMVILLLY